MTEKEPVKLVRVAVIRIRGDTGIKAPIKKTLELLRLYRKHHCVIIANNPTGVGMLTKVKDVVTWGEIDEETCQLLLAKRGLLPGKGHLSPEYVQEKMKMSLDQFVKEFMALKRELQDVPGLKSFFKLKPPERGFERKGIKVPFSLGGSLGYRKDAINDLLRRMM